MHVDEVLAPHRQRHRQLGHGLRLTVSTHTQRLVCIGGAENAVLIDGSVLANAPFRPAIDALQAWSFFWDWDVAIAVAIVASAALGFVIGWQRFIESVGIVPDRT